MNNIQVITAALDVAITKGTLFSRQDVVAIDNALKGLEEELKKEDI